MWWFWTAQKQVRVFRPVLLLKWRLTHVQEGDGVLNAAQRLQLVSSPAQKDDLLLDLVAPGLYEAGGRSLVSLKQLERLRAAEIHAPQHLHEDGLTVHHQLLQRALRDTPHQEHRAAALLTGLLSSVYLVCFRHLGKALNNPLSVCNALLYPGIQLRQLLLCGGNTSG